MDAAEQDLLEGAAGAVVVADEAGRIAFMNTAACALFGWRSAHPAGQPLTVLMPARIRGRHENGFSAYRATGTSRLMGQTVRVPAIRQDGSEIEVELTLRMFLRPDGSRLIVANCVESSQAGRAGPNVIELETRLARRAYQLI